MVKRELQRLWWADPSAIEAMSAVTALAFAVVVFSYDRMPWSHGLWSILSLTSSIPAFIGWVNSDRRWRGIGLMSGVAFWSMVAFTFAVRGDPHGLPYGTLAVFTAWASLRHRKARPE